MKLHNVAKGLQLLAEHLPDDYSVRAEHDELYAGDDTPLPEAAEEEMKRLGWFRCREGGWLAFV